MTFEEHALQVIADSYDREVWGPSVPMQPDAYISPDFFPANVELRKHGFNAFARAIPDARLPWLMQRYETIAAKTQGTVISEVTQEQLAVLLAESQRRKRPKRMPRQVMDIQALKASIDLIEHIQKYVPDLRKNGKEWRGTCPFHPDKAPSLYVNPEKQLWHCFGCNRGGDLITWEQEAVNGDIN